MSNRKFKSRRATPWDNDEKRTASQSFIRDETNKHYQQRHQKLKDTDEAVLINSIPVTKCPFCGTTIINLNNSPKLLQADNPA